MRIKTIKLVYLVLLTSFLATAFTAYLFVTGKFGSHIAFHKASYTSLPGWDTDDHRLAFSAFQRSCKGILKKNQAPLFGSTKESGNVQQWQTICTAANVLKNPSKIEARNFFEKWFEPYHIQNNWRAKTLFTGYYLPTIKGSFIPDQKFNVPVYSVPKDMIAIALSRFDKQYHGAKQLYGQLKGQKVLPYPTRQEIVNGALKGSAETILWCDNAVDLFFAQIQGSAMAQLPDGSHVLLGYAGSNGRHYTPIGNVLIRNKVFTKDNISMQAIRNWLNDHPDKTQDVLNKDQSYIFFHILKQEDPLGTEHVPLTPGRSLAVDTHYIPLGAPVWISTTIPTTKGTMKLKRLLVAQDTGGAIKGMHSDIYWGAGEEAAYIAGKSKNDGESWVLLPRK